VSRSRNISRFLLAGPGNGVWGRDCNCHNWAHPTNHCPLRARSVVAALHIDGGAFPQVRKLSLVELGTHVEVAMVVKHIHCSERTMVAALLGHLTTEMLLFLDRGFFSYELWRQLDSTGVKLLARVVKNLILRPIRDLSDGSHLARIYQSPYDREKDRDGIPENPLLLCRKSAISSPFCGPCETGVVRFHEPGSQADAAGA
jgi:hypothetical protein